MTSILDQNICDMKCFGCWFKVYQWLGKSRIKNITQQTHVVTIIKSPLLGPRALMKDKRINGSNNNPFTIVKFYLWYQIPTLLWKEVLLCFVKWMTSDHFFGGPPVNTFSIVSYRYLRVCEKTGLSIHVCGLVSNILSWKLRYSQCKLRKRFTFTSETCL